MRAYMEKLKARGELLEVTREVNPKHELAAVTDAAHKRWGKPILFHNVKGTALPVLTNTYGSRARLAEIIGIGPDEFCKQWNNLATIASARDMPTWVPATDEIQYMDCKVSDLPLITYSEKDAAPYFTSAMFLGNSLGPLLGGAIAAGFGLRWVFLMTALVMAGNLIWVYYRVPEYRDPAKETSA